MIKTYKRDLQANKGNIKAQAVILLFRIASYFARRKGSTIWLIGLPFMIFYRVSVEWILGIELPAKTRVGPGLIIYHGQGLVINDGCVLGSNVTVRHCTTIGNIIKDGVPTSCPTIGDNVEIGSNTVIIGPIRIGNNVKIGAGSVVIKDTPDNCTVVGNPARIIRHNT
ncbi:serine O-acetyltransferase [Stutzerimonas stutzeri]|uniref:serine O-acetyltransferase n=1 Tax=Stutzerimonas stutzeri TaxID=316 RepID=UPI003C7DAF05